MELYEPGYFPGRLHEFLRGLWDLCLEMESSTTGDLQLLSHAWTLRVQKEICWYSVLNDNISDELGKHETFDFYFLHMNSIYENRFNLSGYIFVQETAEIVTWLEEVFGDGEEVVGEVT